MKKCTVKRGVSLAAAVLTALTAVSCTMRENGASAEKEPRIDITAPVAEPKLDIENLVGTWGCGRCTIVIEKAAAEGEYQATVSWASSAAIHDEWTMTGVDMGGVLCYENCVHTETVYESEDEYATEILYENGTGSFYLRNMEELIWDDQIDSAGEDMIFVRGN